MSDLTAIPLGFFILSAAFFIRAKLDELIRVLQDIQDQLGKP